MGDKKYVKYIFVLSVLALLFIVGLNVINNVHADNNVHAEGVIGIGTKGKGDNIDPITSGLVRIKSYNKESSYSIPKPIEVSPRDRPEEPCITTTPKLTVYYYNSVIGLYDSTAVDVIVQNKDSDSCLATDFNISLTSNSLETSVPVIRTLMPGEAVRMRSVIASGNLSGNFLVNAWAKRDISPSGYVLSNITVEPNDPHDIIVTPFYAELEFGNYRNFDVFAYDEYSNFIVFEDGEINWSSDLGYIYPNGTFYANETGDGSVFATYEDITGNATVRVFEDPCTHETPSINLYPIEDIIVNPEQQVQVIAEITNNDNIDCVQALFNIDTQVDSWEIENYRFLLLNSGETKNITLNLTSPSTIGTEILTVNISHYVNEDLYAAAEKNLTTTRAVPTEIKLIPENNWVPAGLEIQYEVIITDNFGNYYDPYSEGILTWETDAGTIEDGLLMPLYAGDKYINATYELDGVVIEGTANLEVKPTKLDRIELIPNEETVEVNSLIDFNATGYDEYNNTIEINPIWNTTAGEINESGTINATYVGVHDVDAEFTYRALVAGRQRVSPGDEMEPDTPEEDLPSGFYYEEITITGNAELTVTPGPSVDFDLIPSDIDMFVGERQVVQAIGYDEFGNPIDISVDWRIGDSPSRISLSNSYGSSTTVLGVSGYGGGNARVDATYMGETKFVHVHVSWSYPNITLLSPENILLNTGGNIRLNITDEDGIDFATYKINSDPTVHISPSELPIYTIPTSETGHTELEVYAKDIYDSELTENFDVLITELPVINLVSHISGDTVDVGDILVFNMSDEYFDFTYQWDTNPVESFIDEYNVTTPGLYGNHNLTIYASDTEGLGLILNETYSFNLQQAPIITLESPIEGTRVLGGEIINLTITDPDGYIVDAYYSWNDGYHIDFTDPYNIVVDSLFLEFDTNNLTIYAKDNEDLETEINYTFLGENTLPQITMDPINDSIISEDDNVTAYMLDTTGLRTLTYECPIEGLKAVNLEGNLTANHTLNCTWGSGENNLEIIVYDMDRDNTTIDYTIFYDVIGPVITLISPLEGSDINEGDILVFNITDLNGINYTNYTWDNSGIENLFTINYNITVPDLSYGTHNITIYARDELGYESNATFSFGRLIGEGDISGRVWSYTGGESITDAIVQVVGHPEWNATTDVLGNYIIEDVDIGLYDIQASKIGYSIQTVYGIGVIAASETSGINFYLSEYGAINGTVIDWFGTPIENANVTIYEAGTTESIDWTLTDALGHYQIDELSAGWYDVEASATGYISTMITNRPVISGDTTIVNLLLD